MAWQEVSLGPVIKAVGAAMVGLGASVPLIAQNNAGGVGPPQMGVWGYLLLGGGAVLIVTQMSEALGKGAASIKKAWRGADADTDHQRWVDSQKEVAQLKETQTSLKRDITNLIGTIGLKDKQIDAMNKQIDQLNENNSTILEKYMTLSEHVSRTNSRLATAVKASPASPLEVTIDPNSAPIAVHDVGGNPDEDSLP